MEDNEIWRDVPGFEGVYKVSNKQKAKSLSRVIADKNGRKITIKGKEMKLSLTHNKKYLRICFCVDCEPEYKLFHNVVAQSFPEICGEWFEGCIVHHKDHNTFNNTPENLIVMSYEAHIELHNTEERNKQISESLKNYYSNPDNLEKFIDRMNNPEIRQKMANTQRNDPKRSKGVLQFSMDGEFITEFPSIAEAARKKGLNRGNISNCCNGRDKSAGGFIWKFAS